MGECLLVSAVLQTFCALAPVSKVRVDARDAAALLALIENRPDLVDQ
jgi:hypothetical protein